MSYFLWLHWRSICCMLLWIYMPSNITNTLVRTGNFTTANGGKNSINVSIYWRYTKPCCNHYCWKFCFILKLVWFADVSIYCFYIFSVRFPLVYFAAIFYISKRFVCSVLCDFLETYRNENMSYLRGVSLWTSAFISAISE